MTRTRIEAPPDAPDQLAELTAAIHVLESVAGRPGRIATMTPDELSTWTAAMRLHRDAWRAHHLKTITEAVRARIAAEAEADANAAQFEAQGRAAGWWMTHSA